MDDDRVEVRLDAWITNEAQIMEQHQRYLGTYALATETQYRPVLHAAVVDMLRSYTTLLAALSQHPNIRNMP